VASKNPASIFLRLSGFNGAVAVVFLIFYFIYEAKGGQRSYYLLLAAGAAFLAAIGSVFAYIHFTKKILELDERNSEPLPDPADHGRSEDS